MPNQVSPAVFTDADPAAFYLSLTRLCPYPTLGFTPDDGTGGQTWGRGADGSTFVLTTSGDTATVRADGPLWAAIETASARWHALGQPTRDRFGVTAEVGRQWVWLDHPGHRVVSL